jgi:hypothetical protein
MSLKEKIKMCDEETEVVEIEKVRENTERISEFEEK